MGNIAIIHFSPLEMYPPVQNFIRMLEKNPGENKITVFTTGTTFRELDLFVSNNESIRIMRLGKSGQFINPLTRIVNYLLFYFGCLFLLIIKRPNKILYYETISSFPALLYNRFFNRKAELYIHYHEYTSPAEYAHGMKLTRLFHRLEKKVYPFVQWVSHTNTSRMQLFEQDILPIKIANPQIVPNYPPASWLHSVKTQITFPVKTVYVGSLSMDTMYTLEFAEWVNNQNGTIIWHIYSYNITPETKAYLQAINSPYIIVKGGVNYEELPSILNQYDVGIVLYNGHIPNYVFNAPNKLFEYLCCGLDVWYPEEMKGTHSFNTSNTYPRVLALNFNQLAHFDYRSAVNRDKLNFVPSEYFYESAFARLSVALTK